MQRPFVLAISNRKGGSGKSTTVVNLAAEWAAQGRRILVVDLDTQGHAAHGLGVAPAAGAPTTHGMFTSPTFDLRSAVVATAWPDLWCAPADLLFDGFGAIQDAMLLTRQLRRPEMHGWDVVILDTPPSLDLVLTNALAAADGLVVPLLPHALSAEGVKQLTRLVYRMTTTVNPGLALLGLLPVMASERIGHHREVLAELSRQFGCERLLRGIRSDIQLAAAFAARRPIRHFAQRCRGSLDYHLLADELTKFVFPAPKKKGS